jgi:two-component system, NtrC family, sensor histidine kinase HydH
MGSTVVRNWPFRSLPPRRLPVVALLVLLVSIAHYVTPPTHLLLHNIYQRLYYIPLLLACAWFGLRGGLITAAACIILYSPHILLQWAHMRAYQANQIMELAMIGLVGVVAGVLSDRERALRKQAEATASERDRALVDLEKTVATLRRADRLATLGTLAAGMAHEIRNPLGAMGGALEILERDYPQGHANREFMDILNQEVVRLNRVVGKYLDYTSPQAPELQPIDPNAAVRAAVELLERLAARSGVRFECHLDDLPPALADPVQVHQALVNLLLNAIQAMPTGGVAEVETRCVSGAVELVVRDQGEGLPDGPVDRIFEPFFSTKAGGTGLGLAVARQIALSHSGDLTAENSSMGGARFCLRLPTAPSENT